MDNIMGGFSKNRCLQTPSIDKPKPKKQALSNHCTNIFNFCWSNGLLEAHQPCAATRSALLCNLFKALR